MAGQLPPNLCLPRSLFTAVTEYDALLCKVTRTISDLARAIVKLIYAAASRKQEQTECLVNSQTMHTSAEDHTWSMSSYFVRASDNLLPWL